MVNVLHLPRCGLLSLFVLGLLHPPARADVAAKDPLPSWATGAAKRSVVDFVDRVTDASSADHVPEAERIAVFRNHVEAWMSTARHPRFERPYDRLTYRPMQELLSFMRSRGFKTWIVSGGGADFMRVWSERVYRRQPAAVDRRDHPSHRCGA